jgi:uncharacterized membrane protein YraQ (UPF0718 family)
MSSVTKSQDVMQGISCRRKYSKRWEKLIAGGAGEGAMPAFLITGPGASAGVIAGIATIMKKRAIILYVLFLLVGGIVLGYLYDLLLTIGI